MVQLTREEKESGVITAAIFAVVLILLFVLKFDVDKQDDRNEEVVVILGEDGGGGGGGATLNFGESGSGAKFQSDIPSQQVTEKTSQPTEEVVGSDDDKAEAVANTKPVKVRDPLMQNSKPQVQVDRTPKKPTNSALDNLIKGNDQGGGGDGVSRGSYGTGGTGNGTGGGTGSGNGTGTGPGSGSGSGGGSGAGHGTGVGNYNLSGRKLVSKRSPEYICNEEGKVVVQITVDKNGKVIAAQPGARGTTNPAKCLADQARSAAMSTKFDSSDSAPEKQVGTIIYNFKLTE
jgi:outer membrane biosynthesis protein TonB